MEVYTSMHASNIEGATKEFYSEHNLFWAKSTRQRKYYAGSKKLLPTFIEEKEPLWHRIP